MLNPLNALQSLREELVMSRRKLVDRRESIQNVQDEIEAIDRAIADEELILNGEPSKSHLSALKRRTEIREF